MPRPTLTYHATGTETGMKMHDSIRAKMIKEVAHSYNEIDVTITIKAKRKTRSTKQNAYYWSVVLPLILDALIELGNDLQSGNSEHVDMVHELMKQKHLSNGITIFDAEGNVDSLPPSTKRADTAEFMAYIGEIQKWSAEFLHIDIPDPNEQREISFSEDSKRAGKWNDTAV